MSPVLIPHTPGLLALSEGGWTAVLIVGALSIAVYHFWDGWRAGLSRKLVSVVALVLAGAVGYFGRGLWGKLLEGPTALPIPLGGVIGGVMVGAIVFVVVAIAGHLLTRPTRKQGGVTRRLGWGIGGGLVGLAVAALWIVGLAAILRFGGTVGKAFELAREVAREEGREPGELPTVAAEAIRAREALEALPGASVLATLDPVPEELHRIVEKAVRVFRDDEAAYWFVENEASRDILNHPLVLKVANDPKLRELASEGEFALLVRHPDVKALLEDEALFESMRDYDLEAALDYALERKDVPPSTGSGSPL
jgi:hypothetical protein